MAATESLALRDTPRPLQVEVRGGGVFVDATNITRGAPRPHKGHEIQSGGVQLSPLSLGKPGPEPIAYFLARMKPHRRSHRTNDDHRNRPFAFTLTWPDGSHVKTSPGLFGCRMM